MNKKITNIFDFHNPSNTWLFALRFGLGMTILIKILADYKFIYLLYGNNGIIQQTIAEPLRSKLTLNLAIFQGLFESPSAEFIFLKIFFITFFIFAIFLCLGFLTKTSSVVCWLFHVLLFNNTTLILYGFDGFLLTLLFYNMLLPTSKVWSIDNLIFKRKNTVSTQHNRYLKFLQIHLCVVYLVAGIAKTRGDSWAEGVAIWHAINQPQFYNFLTDYVQQLMTFDGVAKFFSWSVLVIEVSYPLLIWIKGINKYALIGILLMHASIGLVMGLWLFSIIMIVFNLTAFGHLIFKRHEFKPNAKLQLSEA